MFTTIPRPSGLILVGQNLGKAGGRKEGQCIAYLDSKAASTGIHPHDLAAVDSLRGDQGQAGAKVAPKSKGGGIMDSSQTILKAHRLGCAIFMS
mmetsp:Transcript_22598/g.52155  ORF Transcript_22598/g.52155 Transcript_22598/m.52155 type:complete len:94 (-) Transcript_22598:485-766(-)